jgi:ribonuclease T1
VAAGTAACGGTTSSSAASRPATTSTCAAQAGRPAAVITTLRLIDTGGPYPYRQDGTVFTNREKLLPPQPSGYYREFTVPTPGAGDRGPRRIVTGKNGERYYTPDHYRSFQRMEGCDERTSGTADWRGSGRDVPLAGARRHPALRGS